MAINPSDFRGPHRMAKFVLIFGQKYSNKKFGLVTEKHQIEHELKYFRILLLNVFKPFHSDGNLFTTMHNSSRST